MQKSYRTLTRTRLLWTLFCSTFTLSAFTFGGGYVIVPLMRKRFVETYGWIEEQEMLDLVAIAQAAPGIIAVNTSILVGYKIAGFAGTVCALLGTVLPPMILLTFISMAYGFIKDNLWVRTVFAGMGVGVAAVILDAVVSMGKTIVKQRRRLPVILMAAAFCAVHLLHVHILVVLLCCASAGIVQMMLLRWHTAKKPEEQH